MLHDHGTASTHTAHAFLSLDITFEGSKIGARCGPLKCKVLLEKAHCVSTVLHLGSAAAAAAGLLAGEWGHVPILLAG